jgi:hypothetical protein
MRREKSTIRRFQRPLAKEVPSRCLRTDRRSPPTEAYRRASTRCPWEVGRSSTFFPVAPSCKARVVAPACKRRCPRFFASVREKPRNNQRLNSDSEIVLVASIGKFMSEIESPMIGQDSKPASAFNCSRGDPETANFAAGQKLPAE